MRRLSDDALRRLRDDAGLSLVETVTALLVFSLIMTGLAAGLTLSAHTMALTKVRNAATSLAQQVVESARTIGVGQLSVCTGGGQPANYTFQGTSYPVVTGTTPCLAYSSTKTSGGRTFNVTQLVIQTKSDTVQSQPIVEKQLIVTVAWTTPTPGSYTTNTLMSGNNTIAASAPVGLRINVNDSGGSLITATNLIWDYTVNTGVGTPTLASGSTDDGTSGLLSLSPGTYTCSVVPEDDAGQSYDPGSNPGMSIDSSTETITGTCTVSAGAIADWTTVWTEVTNCAASAVKGTLTVTVKDQGGNYVNGASVTLTNVNGNPAPSSAALTNSSGVATFSGSNSPQADLYTFTIKKTGYQDAVNLGPVCVAPGVNTSASGSISALSTCVVSKVKGTVTMTVLDETGATVSGAKVVLTNQDGQGSPGSVNTNTSGVALFNNNVLGGNYNYTLSKTGYTNLGPQGPICVTAGANNPETGLLPTSASSGCASSKTNGTVTITVTDQAGTPLNGVSIKLANANTGATITKTSGAAPNPAGTFAFTAPADLYTYTVTPPAGYADPGTQGPVCVIGGSSAATSSVTLTGIMTVKVTVTNSDSQPTKNYSIILRDSNGRATTNSTTINKNKSATLTFANMPTDVYTIEVCVPIAASGNCDDINNTTTTYTFTSRGATYASPNPPTFVDVKGGA